MSNVRSAPLSNGEPRKPSALVTRAQLARSRGAFEQVSAGLVLLASYLGTVFTIAGGVAPLIADPVRLLPWGGALVAQGLLTALQWWYGSLGRSQPVYLVALSVDAGLTTWGFAPLIVPPLAAAIASKGVSEPILAAWALLAVASLLAAWYPESRFVD